MIFFTLAWREKAIWDKANMKYFWDLYKIDVLVAHQH
jgi:hypothetical protein